LEKDHQKKHQRSTTHLCTQRLSQSGGKMGRDYFWAGGGGGGLTSWKQPEEGGKKTYIRVSAPKGVQRVTQEKLITTGAARGYVVKTR